ncbi:ATE1 protein [Phytophthora cinnamomi]|uniref:ATE1 protein n=1 Tax=Phytophthora cinnamomi TaxID=4785 RepID=UPI00355A6C15|nr:ATE1 protein [Phytophthora cinnamomi]
MDFFSLSNLRFLRDAQSDSPANDPPVIRPACAFLRRAALFGPKRPPGLRRRRLHAKAKNCANAKKDEANQRKRKHRQQLASVQDSVQLQEQIRRLDEQLTLINGRDVVAHQNAQGAAYNVMRVYFECVARGFDPVRYPEQAEATVQFFNSAFVKDLKTNDFTGSEKFLEQWQLVNECHANVGCAAASIDVYPLTDKHLAGGGEELERHVNVVKSCGATTLQISRTTIERIFPHILSDEPLVQSLIGKSYSFAFTLIAYVDERDGRIFQTESTVDLTSALLDMLQDPFVTIKMVDAAAMTKRGNLLLMDDVLEDQNVIENGFL